MIAWRGTNAYDRTGQPARAIAQYERAVEIFRESNNRAAEAMTLCNLGEVCAARGERDRARTCLRRAVDLYEQRKDRKSAGRVRARLKALAL